MKKVNDADLLLAANLLSVEIEMLAEEAGREERPSEERKVLDEHAAVRVLTMLLSYSI